ncbi:MAG: EMC3/TMCO1 family protein [Candidatus Hermodarchaeota archaeon]
MLLFIFQDSNAFSEWISYPPGSMIFILLLATITALISTGLTKWLVDTDEINRKQVIKKAHDEEKEKIIQVAETDPERYRKLRKRWERLDTMIKQSQQKLALKRMLPSCITFVPMIIIFSVVRGFFGEANPVALSPMNANDIPLIGSMMAGWTTSDDAPWIPLVYGDKITIGVAQGWINFTAWYFLCSFGISTLVQRILKLQTQAQGGMEQMMGGSKAKALEFPDV